MTGSRLLAAAVLAVTLTVSCKDENSGSNTVDASEIDRVEYGQDNVVCYVYNSDDDTGSGISCVTRADR